jgi:hypothetical protein
MNAATDPSQYLLEFSVTAMKYGFQLLEDIRQIRMACEERRDELEQRFTSELLNWMQYSQQTQQVMSQPNFDDHYTNENRHVVEETIASTYRELYSSRIRRLNVIERQCDHSLENLLQRRKLSMLTLLAELMGHSPGKLNELVREMVRYKTQLQDGLEDCISRQEAHYDSRLSSKVLLPEDYCSGPDIDILTAFLDQMLNIIAQEQTNFFGDDEDLGVETPCGLSGCGEYPHSKLPQAEVDSQQTAQAPLSPSSPLSSSEPPTAIYNDEEVTGTTPPPSPTSTEAEQATPKSMSPSTETATVAAETSSDLPATESWTETKTEYDASPLESDSERPASITGPLLELTSPRDTELSTPTDSQITSSAPEWLDDAVDEALHPQKQLKNQAKDTEGASRSRHHNDNRGNSDNSRYSAGNRHSRPHDIVIDIPGETSPQSRDGDADTSNDIYPLLFYSFATVGGVLLVAVLVLLAAILMVRYKRQHLLESQLLTKEQKISIMKQTGYVNPTYKFLDMQNDK